MPVHIQMIPYCDTTIRLAATGLVGIARSPARLGASAGPALDGFKPTCPRRPMLDFTTECL
jgi:hypothetical protein